MASALDGPTAQSYEDSNVRFETHPTGGRNMLRKLVKKTHTLVSGPNSGSTVDYFSEEVNTASGTLTTGADKAEDTAHVSGDTGSFVLAVRNDAEVALTSADGDYSPLAVDSRGRILSVVNKAEDAAHSSGDVGTFVLAVRNDAAASLTSTDGDYSPIATDTAGRVGIADLGGSLTVDAPVGTPVASRLSDGAAFLTTPSGSLNVNNARVADTATAAGSGVITAGTQRVVLATDQPVVPVSDNGGSLTVDGTVTADTELPAAAALSDAFANPTAPAVGAMGMLFDGTDWERSRVADAASLSGTTIPDGVSLVTNPGNWAQQNSAAAGSLSVSSKAAGGVGVRHVCTALSFGFSAATAPGADISFQVRLRDGATGAGTILWSWEFDLDTGYLSGAGANPYTASMSGLNIFGSTNTAMTLEFQGTVTNVKTFVNLSGYSVS